MTLRMHGKAPEPRQTFVTYAGTNARGGDLFDFTVNFPEPDAVDRRPTPSQIDAIKRLFRISAEALDLSSGQIHQALCCRDYARACVECCFREMHDEAQAAMVAIAAAFILNGDLRETVVAYMEARSEEMADEDELPREVVGAPAFQDVAGFLGDAVEDLRAAGAFSTAERPQSDEEFCIAYLAEAPTRRELLEVTKLLMRSATAQMELVAQFLDPDPDTLRQTADEAIQISGEAARLCRELMHCGVDPEWDYRD